MRYRVHEAAAVRAGLNTKTTSDAILRIDKNCAVWSIESRANRTNLDARGMLAQVAKLRDKEGMQDLLLGNGRFRIPFHSPVGTIYQCLPTSLARPGFGLGNDITLDPR